MEAATLVALLQIDDVEGHFLQEADVNRTYRKCYRDFVEIHWGLLSIAAGKQSRKTNKNGAVESGPLIICGFDVQY